MSEPVDIDRFNKRNLYDPTHIKCSMFGTKMEGRPSICACSCTPRACGYPPCNTTAAYAAIEGDTALA